MGEINNLLYEYDASSGLCSLFLKFIQIPIKGDIKLRIYSFVVQIYIGSERKCHMIYIYIYEMFTYACIICMYVHMVSATLHVFVYT